ncbi:uncharacterized protein LOC128300153 [Anopheles moucheti]|uniref:uncharacterized protein LOC128300153 n=1 Tax=Anopheles moucheti TaxID=186751 RepID=UPI0022F07B2C|nr:uncharacterized protein LOC128300153 [Anopheles moucheti]
MPYVVLKKKKLDLVEGQEDVMVVPDIWVQENREHKEAFVFLPVADCDTVKTYLEKQITPLQGWEKHECDILCRGIPNLIAAYKTIDKLQNVGSVNVFLEEYRIPRPKRLKPAENVVEEDEQRVFPIFKAGQESEDPFGAIIPPLELSLVSDSEDVPFDEIDAAVTSRENVAEPIAPSTSNTLHQTEQRNDALVANLTVTPDSSRNIETRSSNTTSFQPCRSSNKCSRSSNKRVFSVARRNDEAASSDDDAPSNGSTPCDDDAASWYSYTNVRSKRVRSTCSFTKPPEDGEQIAGLFDLMYELKSMMSSNQEEMKKHIRESFAQMYKHMAKLIKQNIQLQMQQLVPRASNNRPQVISKPGLNVITFPKLMVIEDVKRFDEQLLDAEFRKRIHNLIDNALKNETDQMTRLKIALYLIFDRPLFDRFNWGGGIEKIALEKYKNVIELLEYSGTTPKRRMTTLKVVQFIQSEFANTQRLKCDTAVSAVTPTTATTPAIATIPTVAATPTIVTIPTTAATPTIVTIPATATTAVTATMKQVDPTLDEAVNLLENLRKATPSLHVEVRKIEAKTPIATTAPVAIVEAPNDTENTRLSSEARREWKARAANNLANESKCITSAKVLDSFENRLNDTKMRQLVHKWIDKILKHEKNVEKRLLKLFNRLIDIKVLENFYWMERKGDYRPLSEYTNFIQLFVYASNGRRASAPPTPLMRENVNKFLDKQLTYADWRMKETNLPVPSTSVSKF